MAIKINCFNDLPSGNMDAVAKSLKEDYLTCVICYELFVEPKILPCLHTFCKGCLEISS